MEKSNLLQILFDTHSLYVDRASRRAVQSCLRAVFKKSDAPGDFEPFIDRLKAEAAKPGIASASAFVLVEWCALLLQEFSGSSPWWDKWALDLVVADGRALEQCVSSGRQSVKGAAQTVTCRALQAIVSWYPSYFATIEDAAKRLSMPATPSVSTRNATFLGLIANVCAQLTDARPLFEEKLKPLYYGFFVREVLGSRVPVPQHIAMGLKDFFLNYTTEDDLMKEVMPALEKALLRAPEVVLHGVVQAFVDSIPHEIDLSKMLLKFLLKPLLSSTKSTNTLVREGALQTFQMIASRCSDEANLDKVVEEIVKPLEQQKISSTDQRVIYAGMLVAIPPSATLSRRVLFGLGSVASKEPNEAALNALSLAITKHFYSGLMNGVEADERVISLFSRGLADKRPPTRRIWALRTGELLWQLAPVARQRKEVINVMKPILLSLKTLWAEVHANPLQAVPNGLIVAAYVLTAISQSELCALNKDSSLGSDSLWKIDDQNLGFHSRSSFLINHRIYTKLAAEDDMIWFLRALVAVTDDLINDNTRPQDRESWAQAILYLIASTNVKPIVTREARQALTSLYVRHPREISKIIIGGLWNLVTQTGKGERDTAATVANIKLDQLYHVIQCICLRPKQFIDLGGKTDEQAIEEQLVNMLVLCRPAIIPRTSWIDVCQKVGVDPGDLARKSSTQLLNGILEATHVSAINYLLKSSQVEAEFLPLKREKFPTAVKNAAYNAAAELAFVCPEVFTDLLINQVQSDLDPNQLEHVGPLETAIYKTPEGTAFVDVLAQTEQKQAPNKNSKEYTILKWEEELRAQLAEKKGKQRKLTSDEQSKVNAQLAKEASIRHDVAKVDTKLRRGIGILKALAFGPPTDAEKWMGPAISSILAIITKGAGLLVGDLVIDAYLACSEQVTHRLGTLRKSIGIATLRSMATLELPREFEEEPLGGKSPHPRGGGFA